MCYGKIRACSGSVPLKRACVFAKVKPGKKKQANKIFSEEAKYDMKSQRLIGTIFARPTQTLSGNFLDPSATKFMYVAANIPFIKKKIRRFWNIITKN